jgi:hypothetical protein
MGVKLKSLTPREEYRLRVSENRGAEEEYLDPRGRKWQETGNDCIMRSFITCMLHQILLR